VFRTKSESKPEIMPKGKEPTRGTETTIEVPYTDYAKESGHPYMVDYFQLGDTWNEPQGGFSKEIGLIEEYVNKKIQSGEIANSQNAVKELIKKMEKLTRVNKEERSLVRIETIAAHIKFLMATDKIKFNLGRYGNY